MSKRNNMNMNIFWQTVSLYLKNDYTILPSEFITQMNQATFYEIKYNSIVVDVGYKNDYGLFEDNFWMSLTNHLTFKIASIGDDSLVYSNKDGGFKIYYVFKNTVDESAFVLLSGTFDDLINVNGAMLSQIEHLVITTHQSNVCKIDMKQKMPGWSNYDFKIVRNFMRTEHLPNDFVELMKYSGQFTVDCSSEFVSMRLLIGETTGLNLIAEYNDVSLSMPSHVLGFGSDGYSNRLVYSDKDGDYKLYVVSDEVYGFDQDRFVYLADNLYELLIDKKNMDILLNF